MYKIKKEYKDGHIVVAGLKDPITKENVDQYQYLIYKLKRSGNPAGESFEGDEEGVEDSNGRKVENLSEQKNTSFEGPKIEDSDAESKSKKVSKNKPAQEVDDVK